MAATAGVATPIRIFKNIGSAGAMPVIKRYAEKATQTFLQGTPVQIEAATGFIIANPAIVSVATAIIAGFATEPANNLTTSGVPKTLTYGSVQNQASAVLIPIGAPPNDGTMGVYVAADEAVFIGLLGHSATDASAVVAATDPGAIFGLTKDATSLYWYVDKNITTAAGGACVQITELIDPVATLHGKVAFRVTHAAQQLFL